MELILIRHAHPISEERLDGSPADPPLSAAGFEQSRSVANWLAHNPPDRLISSPALRARQTAEATAEQLGESVEIDDRLCDANPMLSRYVTLEEERASDPKAYRRRLDEYHAGEHLAAVSKRVNAALDEWTDAHPGKRIAAFCHGSVVNVYAARVLALPTVIFLDVDYASGHRFLVSRDAVGSVKSLNETSYLT